MNSLIYILASLNISKTLSVIYIIIPLGIFSFLTQKYLILKIIKAVAIP